jgi:hypothetical protein
MKKIKTLLLFFVVLTLSSCDKVDNPFPKVEIIDTLGFVPTDIIYNDTTVAKRKILFEYYTGHQCGQCPDKADVAVDLVTKNSKQLLLMSIHAGYFAETAKIGNKYTYDFKTATGNTYDEFFKVTATGAPFAMINRETISGKNVINPGDWITAFDGLVNAPEYQSERLKLFIRSLYSSEDRIGKVEIRAQANENLNGKYDLVALIVEDKIINWQKKYVGNVTHHIEDYEHKMVLRNSFPSAWGSEFFSTIAKGESISTEISYSYNADWNQENGYVIVIVANSDTHEILAVDKVKLMK